MSSSPRIVDRVHAVRALFQSPRWTRDRLLEYQGDRLRSIVRHATQYVPFYKSLFQNSGLNAEDVRTAEDLAKLPIVGKADIQRAPASFLTQGLSADELVWYLTSGSTGQPMRVCRTMLEERLLQAYRIRAEFQLGMRVADRRAAVLFTGVPRNQRKLAKPTLPSRLGVLSRTLVDVTRPPAEIIGSLRQIRPHVIIGYPGALSRVAEEMHEEDRKTIQPRFVVTGAETLSASLRERIEHGFQTRVYDFYGAHECNLVAWECSLRTGLHINEDNIIVEILREGKPVAIGEEGEVVITALNSYAMPFIRYRLGDLVVRGDRCLCGLPYVTIAGFNGRSTEAAYLSDGSKVSAIPIANVFLSRVDWIRHFQMIQTEAGKLHVSIVLVRTPSATELEDLAVELRTRWDIALSHEFVPDIPIKPAGKRPVFISRLEV